VYSAATRLFADGYLQEDTAHCRTTAHWHEKAAGPGELSYLWALTSCQVSQEEAVLCKALLQLCANCRGLTWQLSTSQSLAHPSPSPPVGWGGEMGKRGNS